MIRIKNGGACMSGARGVNVKAGVPTLKRSKPMQLQLIPSSNPFQIGLLRSPVNKHPVTINHRLPIAEASLIGSTCFTVSTNKFCSISPEAFLTQFQIKIYLFLFILFCFFFFNCNCKLHQLKGAI